MLNTLSVTRFIANPFRLWHRILRPRSPKQSVGIHEVARPDEHVVFDRDQVSKGRRMLVVFDKCMDLHSIKSWKHLIRRVILNGISSYRRLRMVTVSEDSS